MEIIPVQLGTKPTLRRFMTQVIAMGFMRF